jgi:signal transduction histidine kinase
LASRQHGHLTPRSRRRLTGWLATIALVAAVTVVIKLLHPHGPSRGLAVIYILVVLSVAVRWGPAFAFGASLLSAAAFDYFFLSPQDAVGLPNLADAEAFAAFLATAIMASQLAGRLRRQVREAARLAQEQAALRRIASVVARGLPPIEVFKDIAEEAGHLLDAEIALLARRDQDALLTVLAQRGAVGRDVPVGSRWPIADSLSMTSTTQTDWTAAPVDDEASLGPCAEAARKMGIRSSVVSPIVIEGRPWGLLFVATRSTALSANAAQHVGDFSELLATAIRNAENQAELRASRARIVAAADETRRRIERDLHDSAQQRLVSLALSVRAVQAVVPPESHELRAELSQVADGLVSVLDELRELSRGLHPAILAEGGLQPALKALARRSPVAVELNVCVERRLPQQVEVTTYYVVSELLTNAAKHAQASAIHVGVDAPDSVLLLSVTDDGIGGADPRRGSGLIGVLDRVEAIGGTVAVHSPVQAGTRVDVEIPIVLISGDPSWRPFAGPDS